MSLLRRDRLLAALSPPHREPLEARSDVEALLQRGADAIAERDLPLDEDALITIVSAAIGGGVELEQIEIADLYLAMACARGQTAALRMFETEYGRDLDRAIAKSPTLGLSAAEFRQLVFDRLFVSEEQSAPRIARFTGRGSLKAWVRVMTSRFIIDLSRRRARPTTTDDGLAEKLGADDDTEVDYLRHAYGPALGAAFEQAVTELSVRQRNLLRQRYLHEVPADTLARMYAVHRSTVFAWLDKARADLLEHVRRILAQRLPGDQLESVVGVLGSQLQLSVRRMLDSRLETEA